MKKRLLLGLVAVAATFSMVSCDDAANDTPAPTPTSTLSAVKDVDAVAAAGDNTKTLSFKADYDWTASSSQGWLKIDKASGAGGADAVLTLAIEANATFGTRTALVTIVEGVAPEPVTKVVVKVEQFSNEPTMLFKNDAGEAITKVVFTATAESGEMRYLGGMKVSANYGWFVKSKPDWVEFISIESGKANEEFRLSMRIDKTKLETGSMTGSVLFQDIASAEAKTLELEFAGVGDNHFATDLPPLLAFAATSKSGSVQRFFNITTSASYSSVAAAPFKMVTVETVPDPTGGDNYTVLEKEAAWLTFKYNYAQTRAALTSTPWFVSALDNTAKDRGALVLIMPKEKYPAQYADLFNYIEETSSLSLKPEFAGYVVSTITQKSDVLPPFMNDEDLAYSLEQSNGSKFEVSFYIRDDMEGASYDIGSADGGENPEWLDVAVDNVMSGWTTVGTKITFTAKSANDTGNDRVAVFNVKGPWDDQADAAIVVGKITITQAAQ